MMKTRKISLLLVLAATVFMSFGQILFKFSSSGFVLDPMFMLTNAPFIFGVLTYIVAAAILVTALKYGELSVVYPMLAATYVWVSLLSPVFFPTDFMNMVKWMGIGSIVAGVVLVSRGGMND